MPIQSKDGDKGAKRAASRALCFEISGQWGYVIVWKTVTEGARDFDWHTHWRGTQLPPPPLPLWLGMDGR